MAISFIIEEDPESPFSPQTLRPVIIQLITSAYAPISERPSVALGRESPGRLFAGVNVELPGLPPAASIHAEQFLLANLAIHNARKLNSLAISSNGSDFHAPCINCCQFLQEIRHASDTQVLITDTTDEEGTYMNLSTFLPQGFSPHHNGFPINVPRLLEPSDNMLTLMDQNIAREINANCDTVSNLRRRALAAANRSYAPYSKCPSGVALMDRNGEIYPGFYIESEAHNHSLGPVQVALVDFVTANKGSHEFEKIVRAVLVEKINQEVTQEPAARMILGKIAHGCDVSVLYCS